MENLCASDNLNQSNSMMSFFANKFGCLIAKIFIGPDSADERERLCNIKCKNGPVIPNVPLLQLAAEALEAYTMDAIGWVHGEGMTHKGNLRYTG